MSPLHVFRTLMLSIVIFGLTIGAALSGAHRDGLYADPGVLDATTRDAFLNLV